MHPVNEENPFNDYCSASTVYAFARSKNKIWLRSNLCGKNDKGGYMETGIGISTEAIKFLVS